MEALWKGSCGHEENNLRVLELFLDVYKGFVRFQGVFGFQRVLKSFLGGFEAVSEGLKISEGIRGVPKRFR